MKPERSPELVPRELLEALKRLADRAVPRELQRGRPIDAHRARLLVVGSVLGAVVCLASSAYTGFWGPFELAGVALAFALFTLAVPLLRITRRLAPASSLLPGGLFAYCALSTYGSGGALPFAAVMFPIVAFLAGLLGTRREALGWLAALWTGIPLVYFLSPAPAAPPTAVLALGASLLFAVPTLATVILYRGLYEQLLAERTADAEREREAAERQALLDARLRESERLAALGRMAGGIAHDFNNILTAIAGSAEMLAASPRAGSAEREYAGLVSSSAERAAALVRQLLDFTGRGRRKLERVSLCARADRSAQFLAAGLPKQIALDVRVHDDGVFAADAAQIDELVVQLVQNAARSYDGKPGEVTIEVDRIDWAAPAVAQPAEGLPPGSYAVLRVIDRGCGIAHEDLPRVFDPFFASFAGGRGLGLAAVLGIVRGHGGGIAIESAPGAGTRVSAYLPCDAADVTDARPAAAAPPQPDSLAGLRLLVVDDEEPVRAVLCGYLRLHGAAVFEARDGVDALAQIPRLGTLDAALVDVSMPRVDGLHLLEALRSSGNRLRVVLITGHPDVDVARFGEDANVAVLLKPFPLGRIAHAVARAAQAPTRDRA